MLKKALPILFSILTVAALAQNIDKSSPVKQAPAKLAPAEQPVTRAAFDLSCCKFKVVVAEVLGNQAKIKFSKAIDVKLGKDLAEGKTGEFSDRIQGVALAALQELKNEAVKHGATKFYGVAKPVFHKAENGNKLLSRLSKDTGVHLRVVTPEKQAIIGFNTAFALSGVLEENVVSWESGANSFILAETNGGIKIYDAAIGTSALGKIFLEDVRKVIYNKSNPINPISPIEFVALVNVFKAKMATPAWLSTKLALPQTRVVAIGDQESVFGIAAQVTGQTRFTLAQLEEAISQLVDSNNEVVKQDVASNTPETVLVKLALLYAGMSKFGIQEVTYQESSGSTIGILIEADLWR